jgi:hypothetical protein
MNNWVLRSIVAIMLLLSMFGIFHYLKTTTCIQIPTQAACRQVLILGNSFVSYNNLPSMFRKLAQSGGHRIHVQAQAPGGWRLEQHAQTAVSVQQLRSQAWDYLILQEQSQTPAVAEWRKQSTIPAIKALQQQLISPDTQTILYATWGREQGWPEGGFRDYQAMQKALNQGYAELAQATQSQIAPVGRAWQSLQQQTPPIHLWDRDGVHPNAAGSYLAACVFYATIFGESPVGLSYHAQLTPAEALILQQTAEQAVLR